MLHVKNEAIVRKRHPDWLTDYGRQAVICNGSAFVDDDGCIEHVATCDYRSRYIVGHSWYCGHHVNSGIQARLAIERMLQEEKVIQKRRRVQLYFIQKIVEYDQDEAALFLDCLETAATKGAGHAVDQWLGWE